MTANELIAQLQLQPHPEGGFYKETYRSAGDFSPKNFDDTRNYSTAIYFLLQAGDFSAFHCIKSDELWHFYEGSTLLIHVIHPDGQYECIRLGRSISDGEVYQAIVPAGAWFASEPALDSAFALVGCTVSPGFDFADFEMGTRHQLTQLYPRHQNLLMRLCR